MLHGTWLQLQNKFNMEWTIAYYPGSLPLVYISSSQQSYESVETGSVISLTVSNNGYSHTLHGLDYYWVSGSEYGAFNATGPQASIEEQNRLDGGYQEVVYEGIMKCRYRWETEHEYLGELDAPAGCRILEGVMISDEEAQQIGLI